MERNCEKKKWQRKFGGMGAIFFKEDKKRSLYFLKGSRANTDGEEGALNG